MVPLPPKARGAYRIEGHHLAQNYTIVDGKVSDSPSFFGSNPAEVRIGPRKGLRVLALEDDYGYDMIESLDKAQQDVAVVDKTALKDIITGASRKAALNGAPNGLSAAKMTTAQYDKLMTIIELYASNVPQAMAEKRMELARKQPKDATFFAWTGAVERGGLHYYRIQTPGFLIEMDCTQIKEIISTRCGVITRTISVLTCSRPITPRATNERSLPVRMSDTDSDISSTHEPHTPAMQVKGTPHSR